ncbi:MAG: hypothetical protein K0S79_187 [Nitrospira sp.]|nr:hypothetical protein [Nitrospira sp.]
MNAFTRPVLVGPGAQAKLLERIPLSGINELSFDERTLQNLLFDFPEAIPIRDIDPHLGPLIPICTELETGAGPADILFVTPTGQVVLVETKLWRNPEARREVVAQILDYAKQLTSWNYDVLEEAASLAARKPPGHLLRCLMERFPDADQASFVDGIGRSLQAGDFLLLIIGDGIRYGAESLVNFLERYGNLRFSLSLVEAAAFRLPDGQMLLQPRILAKTETLQKTLLLGPSGPVTLQEAAQAEDGAPSNGPQRTWFMEFWRGFLAKLKLPDPSLLPAEPAKSTNQYFPMPPGGASAWISAYIA